MKNLLICCAFIYICAVPTMTCKAQNKSLQFLVGKKLYGCQGIRLPPVDAHLGPIFLSRNLELTVSKIWTSNGDKPNRSKISVLFSFGNSDPMALLSGDVDNVYLEKVPMNVGNLADILNQALHDSGVGLQVSPTEEIRKGSTYNDMVCMFGPSQRVNDYGDTTQYVYDDGWPIQAVLWLEWGWMTMRPSHAA